MSRRVGATRSWSTDDIGDLTGRVALVTGANSGIGFETTRGLAEHGAHVVMACRDEAKARRAYDELDNDLERSSLELLRLDLADLGSVRDAARSFLARHARLDLLVNNAGVMGTPLPADRRRRSSSTWRPTTWATSPSPACCSTAS